MKRFGIFLIILLALFFGTTLILSFNSKNQIIEKAQNKVIVTNQNIERQIENITETIAPRPTAILESGLPDKHLIETTFIPQAPEKNWDQPWQDACEEAAFLTAHYYYQEATPDISTIRKDILNLIDKEKEFGWQKDVNLGQLSQLAKDVYGYNTNVIDNPTLDQIKEYISKDIPVIVPADGKTLYRENRNFRDGGPYYHMLTILGYDDTRGKFTVHDVGTQYGAYFRYSYDLLVEAIHDYPTSLQKEDIKDGEKRVLVLLK
ncbi:MAG: C39 family peptidase [Patescibacteria group bacterium]|jgi:hypothetical protein